MKTNEEFFKNFLREYRLGLRTDEQPILDQLIQDLINISQLIPPTNGSYYSFREILMLITLINQKKIQNCLTKNETSEK